MAEESSSLNSGDRYPVRKLTRQETYEFGLITIIRLQDGKIVEEWQQGDQLRFARQMGMELMPKATEE